MAVALSDLLDNFCDERISITVPFKCPIKKIKCQIDLIVMWHCFVKGIGSLLELSGNQKHSLYWENISIRWKFSIFHSTVKLTKSIGFKKL